MRWLFFAGILATLATVAGSVLAAPIPKPGPPSLACGGGTPAGVVQGISTGSPTILTVQGQVGTAGGMSFQIVDSSGYGVAGASALVTVPSGTLGTGGDSIGFTPSSNPRQMTVTTDLLCFGDFYFVPDSAGTIGVTITLPGVPGASIVEPVAVRQAPGTGLQITVETPSITEALFAPGASAGVGIRLYISTGPGNPVGGAPVTLTQSNSGGATVDLGSGNHSVTIPADPFGMLHITPTMGATPGEVVVYAQVPGGSTTQIADYVVTGSIGIMPSWNGHIAYGSTSTINGAIVTDWSPCMSGSGLFGPNAATFSFNGFVEATPVANKPSGCPGGPPYSSPLSTDIADLIPGTYDVAMSYDDRSSPIPAMTAHASLVLDPTLTIAAAPGAQTKNMQVGVNVASPKCESIVAKSGVAGDETFPATDPPNVAVPYGMVKIDVTQCGLLGAVRVALGVDDALAPGTQVWAYGPTADNASAHWYALATGTSGNFVTVDLQEGEIGDDSLTHDLALHATLAIGVPQHGAIQGSFGGLWWGGMSENGWGMSLVEHGDTLFAALFIYDANGDPRWVVMPGGSWNSSFTSYSGNLYRPTGAPYSRYVASAFVPGDPVGTLKLDFTSIDTMSLAYTLDGVSGTKALQRERIGPDEPFTATNYGDLWWGGPDQNGWGIPMMQQSRSIFAVYFTYDQAGKTIWFVAPGLTTYPTMPDPYSSEIAATYSNVFLTHSSPWAGVPYDPTKFMVTYAGQLFISFSYAFAHWGLPGGPSNLSIQREPF